MDWSEACLRHCQTNRGQLAEPLALNLCQLELEMLHGPFPPWTKNFEQPSLQLVDGCNGRDVGDQTVTQLRETPADPVVADEAVIEYREISDIWQCLKYASDQSWISAILYSSGRRIAVARALIGALDRQHFPCCLLERPFVNLAMPLTK